MFTLFRKSAKMFGKSLEIVRKSLDMFLDNCLGQVKKSLCLASGFLKNKEEARHFFFFFQTYFNWFFLRILKIV